MLMPKRKTPPTDAELLKIATDFRDGLIGRKNGAGYCFMVCAPLAGLLDNLGMGPVDLRESIVKINGGSTNHVWIRLPDGRVLDPTADQFDLVPVYLGKPHPKVHAKDFPA